MALRDNTLEIWYVVRCWITLKSNTCLPPRFSQIICLVKLTLMRNLLFGLNSMNVPYV